MPVNMPTHGHGQGYSDLNFLIPELVSGVQFSKGPYFADQGDFATAGAANINYANVLDKPIVRVGGGDQGYARALAAASPRVGAGQLLAALEVEHNDGPWDASGRLPEGEWHRPLHAGRCASTAGRSPAWAIAATWNSTDQVPQRAIDDGLIGRFGALDHDRRRRHLSLQRLVRVAALAPQRHDQGASPTASATT